MTVAELIAELQKMPADAEVIVVAEDGFVTGGLDAVRLMNRPIKYEEHSEGQYVAIGECGPGSYFESEW